LEIAIVWSATGFYRFYVLQESDDDNKTTLTTLATETKVCVSEGDEIDFKEVKIEDDVEAEDSNKQA
jgi:hypothetical protein